MLVPNVMQWFSSMCKFKLLLQFHDASLQMENSIEFPIENTAFSM